MGRETDGFKFAVTLLAAFGFISFEAYSYFKDASINEHSYFFAITVLSFAIMIVLFFLIYIFLKGYYFEIYNETVHYIAHKIYETAFLLFFLLLVYVLYIHVFKIEPLAVADDVNTVQSLVSDLFIIIVGTPIIVYIIAKVVDRLLGQSFETKIDYKKYYNAASGTFITLVLLLICLTFWPVLFNTLSNSPLQGDVVVDMESLYCTDDVQIPVFIKVTGLNTGLLINISKENSEHNLTRIDSIELEPIHDPDKTASGENLILVGNALGCGNYNVFINNTDLTAGYYEIACTREDKCAARGFYISNNSQQLCIE